MLNCDNKDFENHLVSTVERRSHDLSIKALDRRQGLLCFTQS